MDNDNDGVDQDTQPLLLLDEVNKGNTEREEYQVFCCRLTWAISRPPASDDMQAFTC